MIITVSQLNNFFKGVVDSEPLLGNISVKGEITNYREVRDSLYFSVKDDFAQIDCFAYVKQAGRGYANGMEVILEGAVNYLTASGKVSFFAKKIAPQDDAGEQYKRLMELKKRLESEGCFSPETKRTVPASCKNIGVVSSAEGAVIFDIEVVARRRDGSVNIFLYPVKVQGRGADGEIAGGIAYFSAQNTVDAVILARGGGSNEDLSAFNTERVVRAINASKTPVVSAVGHNVDFTLADFAADKRAATPTEAAELLTADVAKTREAAVSLLRRMERAARIKLDGRLNAARFCLSRLHGAAGEKLSALAMRLGILSGRIETANPAKLLAKGLTQIVKDGKVVKNISELSQGDGVSFALKGGKARALVAETQTDAEE